MHLSLMALYGVGGWLVRKGMMPIRVLLSSIGYTFSLIFATQGVVQTLADVRRISASMRRSALLFETASLCCRSCVRPSGSKLL